jgi:hypothetical protein
VDSWGCGVFVGDGPESADGIIAGAHGVSTGVHGERVGVGLGVHNDGVAISGMSLQSP